MEALDRFAAVRPAGSGAAATWFSLGDADLATHLYRTHRLAEGATLSDGHRRDQRGLRGLGVRLLPMSDDRVETQGRGRRRGRDRLPGVLRRPPPRRRHHGRALRGRGARPGRLPACSTPCDDADVVVVAPVEPDRVDRPGPGGARRRATALAARRDSVVAVSPIIAGAALKGPADRMLRELGGEASVVGVARRYRDVAGTLVIDAVDEA